jgi:hypothetical protein
MVLGVGLGDFMKKEFENFGEVTDQKERGEMLDEGLEIIAGLQSGKYFQYKGEYYRVGKTVFNPSPIQQPRVPIWVGGKWPNKKPFRRAAKWDGVVPIHRSRNIKQPLTVDEFRELKGYIEGYRQKRSPFDYCLSGVLPGKTLSENRELIAAYEAVGVSWWIEFSYSGTGSLKKNQERIRSGPPH